MSKHFFFPLNPVTVGRGVLIDYWSYAQKLGKTYDPNTTHAITLTDLLDCAKEQGSTFQYGDILLVRSGFIEHYNGLSTDARNAMKRESINDYQFVGVGQSEEMFDFIYDNYFAAVVGDQPAWEAWPPPPDNNHHTYCLPKWGLPIGEMWDLEKLAETCRKKSQWEFFISSSPTNVPGGVGSHPNAMAIF